MLAYIDLTARPEQQYRIAVWTLPTKIDLILLDKNLLNVLYTTVCICFEAFWLCICLSDAFVGLSDWIDLLSTQRRDNFSDNDSLLCELNTDVIRVYNRIAYN